MEEVHEEDIRIHVSARIRPTQVDTRTCIHVNEDRSSIYLRNTDNEQKEFEFDNVLGADISQAEVFERVGKEIVNSCLDGYNGTILAYGQTNSGKTYTMQGNEFEADDYEQSKGIMPRAVEYLFQALESKKDELDHFNYQVQCSFVELYNEQIFDLLDPRKQPRLRLNGRRAQLENTRVEYAHESGDILKLLRVGIGNRRTAETRDNRQSSRSHSILILHVETEEYKNDSELNTTAETIKDAVLVRKSSQLNFVDLAGSERLSYSKTERQRMKEAIHINKSLTTFGRVIRALSKKWPHVPYRDSVLTQFLAHSLNSRTAFIITLHPDQRQFDTTASSLQFAQALRKIEHKVWMNQEAITCNNDTNGLTALTKDIPLSPFDANDTSLAFESIEHLTQALDQIEQEKKTFASNFNQLSIKEAEISQKLNAYKHSGTFDSIFSCDSFLDKLTPGLNGNNNSNITPSTRQQSARRRTIFALSSDLFNNSPFRHNTFDFTENEETTANEEPTANVQANKTNVLKINESSNVSILSTPPKSQYLNENLDKDVSLLKTPSSMKSNENDINEEKNEGKENHPSKIPIKSTNFASFAKFGTMQININNIIKPARFLESQVISQIPNDPIEEHVEMIKPNQVLASQAISQFNHVIEEVGNETDYLFDLSNNLVTLDGDDLVLQASQRSVKHPENVERQFQGHQFSSRDSTSNQTSNRGSSHQFSSHESTSNQTSNRDSSNAVSAFNESNELDALNNMKKNVHSYKITKSSPMKLRRKSMARLRLANQIRTKRRTMSLENREVIANAVREFKNEIFNFGTSQARRQQIWKEICQIYAVKCPNQEKIAIVRMRQIWSNLRRRALNLDQPEHNHKTTHVDRLVLDIIKEADANRKRSSNTISTKDVKETKSSKDKELNNNLLYTQLLLKQGEFIKRMIELKLMPVLNDSKIVYRQMTAEEIANPQIELPSEFLPSEEVLESLRKC